MQILKKVLTSVILPLVFFAATSHQLSKADGGQGNLWLKWSGQERELFVTGYVTGLIKGYGRGCRTADTLSPQPSFKATENSALGNCVAKGPSFSMSLDAYAQKATEFYQHYPEDRDLKVYSLLDLLSDSEHKSFIQIDEMYRAGSIR